MTASKIVAAAASSSGSSPLDVDDVFSTHLFVGNGSSKVITNNVDLTEGGMVWVKTRSHSASGGIVDTETGASKYLLTDSTAAQVSGNSSVTAFNNNGFTVGSSGTFNENNYEYASWTFRKAEKFFDVVTYTGDSQQGRQIAHNLGSVPGMIWIKILSGGTDHWTVYHRGITDSDPQDYRLRLNNNTEKNDVIVFNDTAPTSTHFTVSGYSEVNSSGKTYVAYIFAHNNNDGEFGPTADQDIIKCGHFETVNNGNVQDVDLGFEPQFVLLKNVTSTSSGDWWIMDDMRQMLAPNGDDTAYITANSSSAEGLFGGDTFMKNSTGFGVVNNAFASNCRFVYMAIRRGPLAKPTDATKVFDVNSAAGTGAGQVITTGFPVDMTYVKKRDAAGANFEIWNRMGGFTNYLEPPTENGYAAFADQWQADNMTGFAWKGNDGYSSATGNTYVNWNWRRAPGFFDIACYDGSGSNRTVTHNLGAVPEMMWVKCTSNGNLGWMVYHSGTGNTHYSMLNSNAAAVDLNVIWNDTTPTSSVFTVGTGGSVNDSGKRYIAFLFTTLAGISKVGSFVGNGNNGRVIDCGFSSGARFILIKGADNTENWLVFDSVRGIVAGNDPRLQLDNTSAELSNVDLVDPSSSGFIVNSGGEVNASGVTYMFYAVA